jgi:hypothetical protein
VRVDFHSRSASVYSSAFLRARSRLLADNRRNRPHPQRQLREAVERSGIVSIDGGNNVKARYTLASGRGHLANAWHRDGAHVFDSRFANCRDDYRQLARGGNPEALYLWLQPWPASFTEENPDEPFTRSCRCRQPPGRRML